MPCFPIQRTHEALNSWRGVKSQEGCGAAGWEKVLNTQWGENMEHFHFLHNVVECELGHEDGRAAFTARRENLPRDPVSSQ